MQVYLLSFLFVLSGTLGKTPNFYPNFIAAKAASENYNKDLLVFFTKKSNSTCDAAWAAFEKDPIASKLYISTSINIQDFDGAVFLDKYGLNNAPAWLVLDPQGQVKDKWQGDWKKTPTRPKGPNPQATTKPTETKQPTAATQEVNVTAVVAEESIINTQSPSPTEGIESPAIEETEEIVIDIQEEEIETEKETKTEEVVVETASVAEKTTPVHEEAPTTGYVIQTGFFGSASNAQGLIETLKSNGFDNYTILPATRNGSTFHRVISTTYTTENEALQNVRLLEAAGIKGTVKNREDI